MEVLTLQFGHFANHVGAHFWNFEDEVAALESAANLEDSEHDFERLHSQSEHHGTVSWRPRLLLVDKAGALGATLPGWEEPEQEPTDVLWEHGTVTHRSEALESHVFQQDLEREGVMEVDDGESAVKPTAAYDFRSTVRSWTDYLKVRLPHASVHELRGWKHGIAPFAMYFDGLQLRGSADEEPMLDLARRQLELCDRLDAVHTIVDMHNGFGGVASVVHQWLEEEQAKCGRFVMAVQPDEPQQDQEPSEGHAVPSAGDTAWVSAAFSFAGLLNTGLDVWTPVPVPLWSVAPPALEGLCRQSLHEASAPIATALQNVTLPWRLRGGHRPSDLLTALAPVHRPVCGLLQALPFPQAAGEPSTLAECSAHFLDLACTPALPSNPYTSVVLRGDTPRRLVALCRGLPALAQKLSFVHAAPLPLPVPFPQVFSSQVSPRGVLAVPPGPPARLAGEEVEACPVATQLHAATGSGRCAPLHRMACAMKAHRHSPWAALMQHRFALEPDEFREVAEIVTDYLECGAAGGSSDMESSD